MKPKVYIETSFLSYLASKPSRNQITAGRQSSSRKWWDNERQKYELMVSAAGAKEIQRGDPDMAERRWSYLKEAQLFPITDRMLEIARLLVVPGAIPERASEDAIHVAAAAVEQCEFLLTWNFKHIANVRIRREVERILLRHGYSKTTICTPDALV